ncbi:MAG: hypothetical protein ACKV2Q_24655 [Planctomycetaceae bacterium]
MKLCDSAIGFPPVVNPSGLINLPLLWAIARDLHEHKLSKALLLRATLLSAASRPDEAMADFERLLTLRPNNASACNEPAWQSSAFDWFFLAMSFHKLGEPQLATQSFDRALQWQEAHPQLPPSWSRELTEIRAEAESLLGR